MLDLRYQQPNISFMLMNLLSLYLILKENPVSYLELFLFQRLKIFRFVTNSNRSPMQSKSLIRDQWHSAAKGSDLVNFSVGSSSDSQQDLKVILRVPGGDIQSCPVLEIHLDVYVTNIPPKTCHTHSLSHTLSGIYIYNKTDQKKWAAEKTHSASLCLFALCRSAAVTHTHTHTFLFLFLSLLSILPTSVTPSLPLTPSSLLSEAFFFSSFA